jgi:indole-3-glycerol phosphate synthase
MGRGKMLEGILEHKRQEIAPLRKRFVDWAPPQEAPKRRPFVDALRGERVSLIAEFKRRSPSRGDIRPGADAGEMARTYERAGAAAMSVLTDEEFFGGSLDYLKRVRGAARLPVLRKDFIIDRCQIAESAGLDGPDCLLLIAAALDDEALRALRDLAAQCGQAALVEVHDEAEVERAVASGAEIIGINNRDLTTFQVSLDTTLRLRPRIPEGLLVVSESGIHSADDVRRLAEAGVDAMLIGEALMSAEDAGRKIKELLAGS